MIPDPTSSLYERLMHPELRLGLGLGLPAGGNGSAAISLDFTTITTLDSRITFTRASSATRVNASGLIETVSSDVPRFDYDPATLTALGLLVEGQRTNLCLYSEQFDNGNWVKSGSSITANAIVAPDGATTADKLVESATTAAHYVTQAISVTSGVTYTFSFYAKAGERSVISCRGTAAWAADPRVRFTLSGSGSYVVDSGTPTASIVAVGNGWYRCSFTATTTSSASNGFLFELYNGAYGYAGDGTSGLYIWGAQAEAGDIITSYIPTSASQVTRAADLPLISGTNLSAFLNASEGSFQVNYYAPQNLSGSRVSLATAPISAGSFLAMGGNTGWFAGSVSAPGKVAGLNKQAIAYRSTGDFASCFNGAAVSSSSSSDFVGTATTLNIGHQSGGGSPLNGHIRSLAYYRRRLSNVELQSLTV